jgi:hypothetical protein
MKPQKSDFNGFSSGEVWSLRPVRAIMKEAGVAFAFPNARRDDHDEASIDGGGVGGRDGFFQ